MQKLNQSKQISKSLKFHLRVATLSKIIMNFTLKYMTRKSLFKHDQSQFINEYDIISIYVYIPKVNKLFFK
jgi:hypothetical protein